MHLHLSINDGVPIYRQIVNQLRYLIVSSQLAADEELPPIRTLAEQLRINPNTVARAYRELEAGGLVYTRRGAGTYVASTSSPLAEEHKERILRERIDALLAEAAHFGYDIDHVIDKIKRAHTEMQNRGAA